MMQTAGQAASQAATAERVAQEALKTAEEALQRGRADGVQVRSLGDRVLISMPSSDGTRREMELSSDGRALLSIDGISTAAIQPARRKDIPTNVMELMKGGMTLVAIMVIVGPFVRAFARRLERRPVPLADDATRRLVAIEQAVESVAIEVERISEGQRFTSKLLADRANAAAPVGVER